MLLGHVVQLVTLPCRLNVFAAHAVQMVALVALHEMLE